MKTTQSQSAFAVFVVVAASQTAAVASFSTSVERKSQYAIRPGARSRMNLLPSEGSALVAGWNDVYGTKTYDSHSTLDVDEPPKEFDVDFETVETICRDVSSKPRTFLARLFSFQRRDLTLGGDTVKLMHGVDGSNDENEGSLLYPVVGFRWVRTADEKYRVLPTMNRASCSIAHIQQQKGEKVFGWYKAEAEDDELQP